MRRVLETLQLPQGIPLSRAAAALSERTGGPVPALTWLAFHATARELGFVVVWGPRDVQAERKSWREAQRQSRQRLRREK